MTVTLKLPAELFRGMEPRPPNAEVALHTGRLHLRVKAGTLTGRGRSFLSWKPSPHLAFELDCDRPLRRMTDEDNGVLVHMAVASNP